MLRPVVLNSRCRCEFQAASTKYCVEINDEKVVLMPFGDAFLVSRACPHPIHLPPISVEG